MDNISELIQRAMKYPNLQEQAEQVAVNLGREDLIVPETITTE
jgi:hypothetical protein